MKGQLNRSDNKGWSMTVCTPLPLCPLGGARVLADDYCSQWPLFWWREEGFKSVRFVVFHIAEVIDTILS